MSRVPNPLGNLRVKNFLSPVKAANLSSPVSPTTATSPSPQKSPSIVHVSRPSDGLLKVIQQKKKQTPITSPGHSRKGSYEKVQPQIKTRHTRTCSIVDFGQPTYDILISSTLAAKASIDCKGFCFTPYGASSVQELVDSKSQEYKILNDTEAYECKLVIEQLSAENKKLVGESSKLSWNERRRVRNLSQELDKNILYDEFERSKEKSLAVKRINNLNRNEKTSSESKRREELIRSSHELKNIRSSTEKLKTQEELERSQNKLKYFRELKENHRQTLKAEALDKREDLKEFIECVKEREEQKKVEEKNERDYKYSEKLKFKLKQAWLENQNLKKKLELEKKLLLS